MRFIVPLTLAAVVIALAVMVIMQRRPSDEIVNVRREGNIWQWSRGGVDYYYKAFEQELFIKQSDGSFVRVDRWTFENAAMVDRVGAVIHGQV